MITPTIETVRMFIRPLKMSDANAIFNNWATDPDVLKYVRWNAHNSVDTTLEWVKYEEENIDNPNSFQWTFVYKENNEIIGSGSLSFNEKQKMFEIGYAFMKKYWNKGLATEAAEAIVDFAVNGLKQKSVFAMAAKGNLPSNKVLEKAGFIWQNDGQYSSFDGKRVFNSNEFIFSITPAK